MGEKTKAVLKYWQQKLQANGLNDTKYQNWKTDP